MTNRLFRAFGASLIVLSALATAIPANAATMPWTWTDISDQLTVRQNRPIWAMAYASPFWYYTDGQDLWNGGQVYRFDGQTQVNITTDVRNTGISRVDDIVTDGTNVIFFQDIVRLDNNVQAVMYRNGSYRNITSTIRQSLDWNEGISSIVGHNGTWFMTSTRARFVKFNEDISSYTRLTAPSDVRTLSSSDSNLLYSVRDRMDRGTYSNSYAGISIATIGNNFLMVAGRSYLYSAPSIASFYRFDGQTFTKISGPNLTGSAYTLDVNGLVSNGSNGLLITGQQVSLGRAGKIYSYDGSSWIEVVGNWSCVDGAGACNSNDFADTSNFSATWDGSQWMIVSGKNLFRIVSNNYERLGQTRDYFVTAASNGSGAIILGGAVSDLSNTNPTYPLTAKLVKAIVGVSTTQTNPTNTTTNTTNQTAYGISSWTWIDPAQNYIRRDQNLNFNVGAQSAKGLKKIEIVINGTTAKTCDINGSTANQTCAFSIWGGTYGLGTTIAVNAKVTDNKGDSAWTALQYLTVTDAANGNTSTNTNNNNVTTNNFGLSAWQWLDPGATTIGRSQNVTFNIGAQHANGLNRVELYVNGVLRKTCSLSSTSANQTCSIQLYGTDYAAGTSVSLNAKVIGTSGEYQQLWTPVMTLSIATDTTISNQASAYDITAWQWLDPNQNTVRRDQSVTYNVSAQNANGLNRAEIWVNGIVRRSCQLTSTASSQTCSLTINGSDYAAGSQIAVNAKVVGTSGEYQQVWLPLLTLNVTDANGTITTTPTTQNPSAPTTWIWVIPPGTNLLTSPASYHVGAWDGENGIRRIEIWVNGSVKRVCTFPDVKTNVECGWDILLGDYPSGSEVFVNAKVEDAAGNVAWAQSQSWRVVANTATTSQYVPNMALYLFNLYKK